MAHGGKRDNSGRKLGGNNAAKQSLLERVEAEFPGYDPLFSMIKYANAQVDGSEARFMADKEITPYIHGKKASVTIDGKAKLVIVKDYSPQIDE